MVCLAPVCYMPYVLVFYHSIDLHFTFTLLLLFSNFGLCLQKTFFLVSNKTKIKRMKNSISIQTSDPYTHQIHGPITIILIFFPGSKAENGDNIKKVHVKENILIID